MIKNYSKGIIAGLAIAVSACQLSADSKTETASESINKPVSTVEPAEQSDAPETEVPDTAPKKIADAATILARAQVRSLC